MRASFDQSEYAVSVPEGVSGDWRVERFTVTDGPELAMYNMRETWKPGGGRRQVYPGTYTRLMRENVVVMSDTHAEIYEHMPFLRVVERTEIRRILINGLGLGMCLQHALRQPHVEHIDVIENSRDVIDLVAPHYSADDRLSIRHADVMTCAMHRNMHWDVVWHDIWDNISGDNVTQLNRLKRRFGKRSSWQRAWCEDQVRELAHY